MRHLLLFVACIAPCSALAAGPPQWGALEPGPHAVGYRVVERVDVSRRYGDAAREWAGARPAELRAEALADITGALVSAIEDDTVRNRRLDEILAMPTAAVRDAAPAAGRFPVVLHVPGALTQSVLLEYLASCGYVVLSAPLYNEAPAFYGRGDPAPASLLDTTEDLARLLDEAARLPFADVGRAAAIGMFAQAGLALQMRGAPLRGLACLECGDPEALGTLPFYDPARVRIPVLELRSSLSTAPLDQAPFTAGLRAATRFVGRFDAVEHADFFPYRTIASAAGASSRYGAIASVVRRFLDYALMQDLEAAAVLRAGGPAAGGEHGALAMRVREAEDVPPTAPEFLGWLRFGPMPRARAAWERYGPTLVTRDRMFATVLFLARDGAPQAHEAAAMFRRGFPAGDHPERRAQDERLTVLLGGRRPAPAR